MYRKGPPWAAGRAVPSQLKCGELGFGGDKQVRQEVDGSRHPWKRRAEVTIPNDSTAGEAPHFGSAAL